MTAPIETRARARPATAPGAERPGLRELDDSRVVAAYLAGRDRAFDELVDRYQKRLLNFIYRTIGDRERAEDLVQEVFIRVHRHLQRFDQSKKFSTWIYTIASNLAKNELRNRSRSPLVLFQTIKKNWEADHRPLQFEDPGGSCASWSKHRSPSSPSTTAWCSCCGSWKGRATKRSPRSRSATWVP
jgi:RNA polymerase sigma-70 factor (ECF subfamily)